MRRLLPFICLLIIALQAHAQPSRTYTTVAQRKAFYLQLAKKYNSPAIQEILSSDTKNAFDQYVDGHTEEELIDDFGTVIHELLHAYDAHEMEAHTYFIATGAKVRVPMGKYYNSKELNAIVRKGAQDSVFRYGLYIGGRSDLHGMEVGLNKGDDSEVMSVKMGMYGIVEEYNAYYHDNQATYELYDYFLDTYGPSDAKAMSRYMEMTEKATVACHEFRLFVGWYLVHAKNKHPEIYNDMLSNKALRAAFTLIDDKYQSLVRLVAERKASLSGKLEENAFNLLDFSGSDEDLLRFIQLSSDEEDVKALKEVHPTILKEYRKLYDQLKQQMEDMDPGGKMRTFANIPQQVAYLKRLMTPEMRTALEAFHVKGLDEGSWRKFAGE